MPQRTGSVTKVTWKRRIVRWLVLLAIIYGVWFAVVSSLQEQLIFPRAAAGLPLPKSARPAEVEEVWISGSDGARVEAWFLAAPGADAAHPAPAVMFFHGNGELIDHQLDVAAHWRGRGYSVLIPEYRGYGRSGGRPSEPVIVEDIGKFRDWLEARADVDPRRVVLHGRSLGTGVAAQLAGRREPAALVLESPFTSIASFAWRYLVPPVFLHSPFRTDRVLPRLECPILILHSRSDEIIPIEHGQRLHALAPGSVFVELDGSHNSGLSSSPEYWRAVDQVLEKLK